MCSYQVINIYFITNVLFYSRYMHVSAKIMFIILLNIFATSNYFYFRIYTIAYRITDLRI
jgi:hypothetical protein